MKTTRKLIIEYLKARRTASAAEISRTLHLTQANIRHHLSVLLGEGVVQIASERPTGARGRPTHLYSLTEEVRGHNLDGLADALLQGLLDELPAEAQSSAFKRVARHISGGGITPSGSLTQRLNATIRRLNELHYQARWEARADAPHLLLGHCPYAAVLPQHPELCQIDASLLEGMLDTPVAQKAKLAHDGHGGTYCLFLLNPEMVRKL